MRESCAFTVKIYFILKFYVVVWFEQITDPANKDRYEVPHENIQPFQGSKATNLMYRIEVTENPFGISVIRNSNNNVL